MFDNARLQMVRASARLCAVSLGTRAVVLDSAFRQVESFAADDMRAICDFVNAVPDAAVLCITARKRGARRAAQLDGAYFFGCHAELVEGIVPVRENEVISGYVAIGPILLAPADPWLIEKIVDHLSVYSIPEDTVRDHMKCVPIIEPDRFKQALRQLAELVTIPVLQSETFVSERDDADLDDEISATALVKGRRRCLRRAVPENSSVIERFIVGQVRLGNISGARHAIGERITARIQPRANMNAARLAALEVVSGLWRAAMEVRGNDLRFTARSLAVVELSDTETIDEILDWATSVVRTVARGANAIPREARRTLQEAQTLVRRSLAERFSISDVARAVGTTPDELDRLFDRYLGMSFRTYLVMVRLAVARRLLRETALTASEIARKTGFADQSNFTKAFEKYEGITPIQYRTQRRARVSGGIVRALRRRSYR